MYRILLYYCFFSWKRCKYNVYVIDNHLVNTYLQESQKNVPKTFIIVEIGVLLNVNKLVDQLKSD